MLSIMSCCAATGMSFMVQHKSANNESPDSDQNCRKEANQLTNPSNSPNKKKDTTQSARQIKSIFTKQKNLRAGVCLVFGWFAKEKTSISMASPKTKRISKQIPQQFNLCGKLLYKFKQVDDWPSSSVKRENQASTSRKLDS